MSKFWRWVIVAIVAVALFASIAYVIKRNKKSVEIFETAVPTVINIENKAVATGNLIPLEEILIKPNINGIVEELYVEPGQKIMAGELIAKLRVIPDASSVTSAVAQVNSAKIQLKNANIVYNRTKNLHEKGLIATSELDNASISLNNAKEGVRAAQDQLTLAKTGTSNAFGEGGNTLVRSTVSGTILDVPIKKGNQVIQSNTFNEGTTIAKVADMSKMIFEGKVDEAIVGKISIGTPIEVTIGALPDAKLSGTLYYISPQGVEENGAIQFEIKAQIEPDQNVQVRAGYSANGNIIIERKSKVMAISEALLQYDDKDEPFVEVKVGDNNFEKRNVVLGVSDGINVEVKKGIKKDDKIKIWNVLKKEDGEEG